MNGCNNSCVLFFIKHPVKGRVKTRLAAALGTDAVVELYRNFVLDTLSTLQQLNVPFRICYYPGSAEAKLIDWLGPQYSYMAQRGADLGRRMKNAFLKTFDDNFRKVVIIGSDSPDLPADFITRAFDALDSNGAVIGPCADGGYYLIGFSHDHFLPEAFDNIPWSTDSVFKQTVDVLNRNKCRLHTLPRWYDVDTPADLKELLERNRNTDFCKSKTLTCLMQMEGKNGFQT